MIQLAKLQFNPFGENTYILYNSSKDCIIVDPGCSNNSEREIIANYLSKNEFNPILVVATHGHIDHICGASFLVEKYGIPFAISSKDSQVLTSNLDFCESIGFDMDKVPAINIDLLNSNAITLGSDEIKVIHTPGHTQGGVCLLFNDGKMMLSGDTLFHGSIGRTDLPGGDYDQLMESIIKGLLPLGDVRFFPGHGSDSTFANEVQYNPFISEVLENRVNPVYED